MRLIRVPHASYRGVRASRWQLVKPLRFYLEKFIVEYPLCNFFVWGSSSRTRRAGPSEPEPTHLLHALLLERPPSTHSRRVVDPGGRYRASGVPAVRLCNRSPPQEVYGAEGGKSKTECPARPGTTGLAKLPGQISKGGQIQTTNRMNRRHLKSVPPHRQVEFILQDMLFCRFVSCLRIYIHIYSCTERTNKFWSRGVGQCRVMLSGGRRAGSNRRRSSAPRNI